MRMVFLMNNNPIRLEKREDNSMSKLDKWLWEHANIILPLLAIVLILLIVGLVLSIAHMGGGNVTMVESGQYYNHLQDII